MKPRVPASKYKQFIAFVDFIKSNNATQFFMIAKNKIFYEDEEYWIVNAFQWRKFPVHSINGDDFWRDLDYRWWQLVTNYRESKTDERSRY